MVDVLSCVIFALALTASLYFVKFWRQSQDRLFAIFALAFAVLGTSRLVLAVLDEDNEARTWVYALRLAAFVLIVAAVIDKNRASSRT